MIAQKALDFDACSSISVETVLSPASRLAFAGLCQ
jgi:hypothetical protein